MSDLSLSDIDFNNKIVWVRTALQVGFKTSDKTSATGLSELVIGIDKRFSPISSPIFED